MIKSRNGKVEGKGTEAELLADLAQIVCALIEEDTKEELIDVAVGLGKARSKGKKEYEAYKTKTIQELQKKKNAEAKTIAINLSELIKQVKEEKDGE